MDRGAAVRMAIRNGFSRAFSTIVDSNLTTLITGLVLYFIGTDQLKGFAVTLMIGLLSSMIGALIVTRVIFMWVIDKGILKTLNSTRIIPDKVFDILSSSPKFIIASLVVTAISFATLGYKGSASFGMDFRGGGRVDIIFPQGKEVSEKEVNDFVRTLKQPGGKEIGTTYLQEKKDPATGATNISVRCEEAAGPIIDEAVKGKWKDASTSVATVGSVLGVESMRRSSRRIATSSSSALMGAGTNSGIPARNAPRMRSCVASAAVPMMNGAMGRISCSISDNTPGSALSIGRITRSNVFVRSLVAAAASESTRSGTANP
jgi:SecD/SecF fusion protein